MTKQEFTFDEYWEIHNRIKNSGEWNMEGIKKVINNFREEKKQKEVKTNGTI